MIPSSKGGGFVPNTDWELKWPSMLVARECRCTRPECGDAMMTKEQLSRYRQSVGQLVKRVDWLSSRCLFVDPLVQGSAFEVYRRCGRKGCACNTDPKKRHGPYKVIHARGRGKRPRQVCLRRSQEKHWSLAQRYQYQMKRLTELKLACQELQRIVQEVIQLRIMEIPIND